MYVCKKCMYVCLLACLFVCLFVFLCLCHVNKYIDIFMCKWT